MFAILPFVLLSAGNAATTGPKDGVAAESCSLTGGVFMPDTQRCECYQCFSGLSCSSHDPNCVIVDGEAA